MGVEVLNSTYLMGTSLHMMRGIIFYLRSDGSFVKIWKYEKDKKRFLSEDEFADFIDAVQKSSKFTVCSENFLTSQEEEHILFNISEYIDDMNQ